MLSGQDLFIVLGLAVFVFGAKRLPELASAMGKSMREFRKGTLEGAGEDATPAPVAAASAAPPAACAACKAALDAAWTHCPRCGARVGVVAPAPATGSG
jgi:TatA/E family protein of Tat protein translocase